MIVAMLIAAYLLGSIPCSYLAARFMRGVDARRVGSGNLGAMNVARNVGLAPGLLGGIGDLAKGMLAVLLAGWFTAEPWVPAAAGVAAVIGHGWPQWLRGAGGKGLATSLGAMLVLYAGAVPWILLATAAGLVLVRDTMMGVAIGVVMSPLILWLSLKDGIAVLFGLGLAAAVLLRLAPDIKHFGRGRRRIL